MEAAENSAKVSCSESEVWSDTLVNRFKLDTSKLLNRFLKYFKFEDFKVKYYPEIYKSDPELLKDIYNQILAQLKVSIKSDLDGLCNEQDLYQKLEYFGNLDKEACLSENVKAWRPSGDPHEDIKDHKWKYWLLHKKLLETYLENICSQNDQLEKVVMTEHEEIMMLKEKIIKQDEQNKADLNALEEVDFSMLDNIEQMVDDC